MNTDMKFCCFGGLDLTVKTVLIVDQTIFEVCQQDFTAIILRFDVMWMCNNILPNSNNTSCPNFSKQPQDNPILAFYICANTWLGIVWEIYGLFAHSIERISNHFSKKRDFSELFLFTERESRMDRGPYLHHLELITLWFTCHMM